MLWAVALSGRTPCSCYLHTVSLTKAIPNQDNLIILINRSRHIAQPDKTSATGVSGEFLVSLQNGSGIKWIGRIGVKCDRNNPYKSVVFIAI